MRTPHSSCRKGKRVKITLRNGAILTGKFYDKKSGTILIKIESLVTTSSPMQEIDVSKNLYIKPYRIHMSEVRAFSIYKPIS